MRGIVRLMGILGVVAAMGAVGRSADAGPPAPAIPAGAMVYADTPDLSSLLAQWEASAAKKTWESGAARELFIRSRVFLKWEDRLGMLSALAGRELDLDFLRQLDARRAVLAVYDPGRREGLLAVETGPAGRAAADAVAVALEARDADGTAYRGRYLEDGGVFLGLWRDGATVYLATSDRLLREVIRRAARAAAGRFRQRLLRGRTRCAWTWIWARSAKRRTTTVTGSMARTASGPAAPGRCW